MGKAMRKDTILLIISILSISTTITISSSAAPIYNPFNIYGYIYLNGESIIPNEVRVIFANESFDAFIYTHDDYHYLIQIWDNKFIGQTGTFEVLYNTQKYIPVGTVTIENGKYTYDLDLTISASGEPEPDPEDENQAPLADASGPYTGYIRQTITFKGSGTPYAGRTIESYNWDFGDETTATGKTVTHTYNKTGKYTITLTVIDDEGEKNTDTTYATITDKPNIPPNQPTINGTQEGFAKKNYQYEIKATDLDNDTIKYIINWDGETETTTNYSNSNETVTVKHSWNQPGTYNISVYAIDIGNSTSQTNNLTILINKIYCESIGFLIENTNDNIYDLFYSNSTGKTTNVLNNNEVYYIDTNNDSIWDYTFNSEISKVVNLNKEGNSDQQTGLILDIEFYDYIAIALLLITIAITAFLIKRHFAIKKRIYYLREKRKVETEKIEAKKKKTKKGKKKPKKTKKKTKKSKKTDEKSRKIEEIEAEIDNLAVKKKK
jgi:hypothetical protein